MFTHAKKKKREPKTGFPLLFVIDVKFVGG